MVKIQIKLRMIKIAQAKDKDDFNHGDSHYGEDESVDDYPDIDDGIGDDENGYNDVIKKMMQMVK